MGRVSSIALRWQKTLSVYLNFEKENTRAKWVVFKFWVKNKRVKKAASRKRIWWTNCVNVAVKAINNQIESYYRLHGRSTMSIRQHLNILVN